MRSCQRVDIIHKKEPDQTHLIYKWGNPRRRWKPPRQVRASWFPSVCDGRCWEGCRRPCRNACPCGSPCSCRPRTCDRIAAFRSRRCSWVADLMMMTIFDSTTFASLTNSRCESQQNNFDFEQILLKKLFLRLFPNRFVLNTTQHREDQSFFV